ncbi:hypothetical protein PPA04_06900 [Pediococcus parvulus]|nr:hypothetical protein PPA04_06900 [Pediococcus parvulus]GHC07784.1 hypothetical protein GCM10008912_09180 [Pediococcus parvulus]
MLPETVLKKSECREAISLECVSAPSAGRIPALGVFTYSRLPPETVLRKSECQEALSSRDISAPTVG